METPLVTLVLEKARAYSCLDYICSYISIATDSSSSICKNVIQVIQEKEGNQPCFGSEKPLLPHEDNPELCAILECCWKEDCDSFRRLENWNFPGGRSNVSASNNFLGVIQAAAVTRFDKPSRGGEIY